MHISLIAWAVTLIFTPQVQFKMLFKMTIYLLKLLEWLQRYIDYKRLANFLYIPYPCKNKSRNLWLKSIFYKNQEKSIKYTIFWLNMVIFLILIHFSLRNRLSLIKPRRIMGFNPFLFTNRLSSIKLQE